MRFMLASGNAHKLREFAAIFAPHEITPMPAGVPLPPEGTESFAENARAKALALREAVLTAAGCGEAGETTAAPTARDAVDYFIADDSGLEVEALRWAPGVISSRYAGREGDDAANIAKLLEALRARRALAQRRARFVCWLAAVAPGVGESVVKGEWWGTIALAPHGEGGFGYDPVFMPEGSDLTVAEWPQDRKDQASHRALAGRALLERLTCEGVRNGP